MYEEELKEQENVIRLLKNNEPLPEKELRYVLNLANVSGDEDVSKFFSDIGIKLLMEQSLSKHEIDSMVDHILNVNMEIQRKERKGRGASFGHVTRRILRNEPLKGKSLELALEITGVLGDDDFSRAIRNIGVKLSAGEPLTAYESHIMIDVLLPQARLGF